MIPNGQVLPVPYGFTGTRHIDAAGKHRSFKTLMMEKISPLGPRQGIGTFDTLYDTSKYASHEDAAAANDVAVVDFVQDESGIIYFEAYHIQHPEHKTHHRLDVQHFPFGVDYFDDLAGCTLGYALLKQPS